MRGDQAAVFALFFFFAIGLVGVIFYSLLLRYRRRELQHKERLAALEKGSPLPQLHEAPWSPQPYLLRGMMWLFSGIAIILLLGALAGASHTVPNLEERLYRAKRLGEMGATQDQIKQAEAELNQNGMPAAFALLGLIPSGVGLAYLIFYRMQGKNMVAVSRHET
jgi:hypothetical protein